MFGRSRVVWNEGLFIKPQHFQQQQRFLEYHIEERIASGNPFQYGLTELSINLEYLAFGRIAIERATGIMPDGSVFRIPQEDTMPEPLDIEDASLVNQIIYLAVPLRSHALREVDWPNEPGTSRFESHRLEVRDVHTLEGDSAQIEVSPLKMQLLLEREDRSSFASVAIAKIVEKRPDGSIVLDDDFIPCMLDVACHGSLHRFVNEISGLMSERAKNIAQRMAAPAQGGVAEVSDFMLLQALNRWQPKLKHLSELRRLHPERLFENLISLSGELTTFTDESRLPVTMPNYDHAHPNLSFGPVIRVLRQSLSIVLQPKAISIQLDVQKYGLRVAPILDSQLIKEAEFIVAVKAKMPSEELQRLFIQQTKVSSAEKIRDLVSLQLPGVPLLPIPVAPRQLPYHAGFSYYKLDKNSPAWEQLSGASGLAFHIAGEFEGLDMQFWAIRS
ncbi:type VI secretion system baseplate subunit TssK [Vibrio sp. LaRot3]|uniref:type VI secretion system baseplate subunit TssK n=1 Tax=Vibrio sp. LaRot3 TaxID=2998829 RepID=UPI0022CE2FFC|nr:type VI secretion system baseplate subunit TssK [Vibrio sp. LaRot3]MDA0148882.1 type VI secretion system baseplate subunit TssK [Vibrio sp. LaRot3]